MGKKAVFIDRDGTINKHIPYLDNIDNLILIDGVAEAIKLLNKNNFFVIVITNQSGLGRGFFSLEKLGKLHEKLITLLSEKEAEIDNLYFCPHMPEDGCSCRKPETGLLDKAREEFSIDPKKSFMIGDRLSDVEAGQKFGCQSILVLTGYGKSELDLDSKSILKKAIVSDNLHEAVKYIVCEEGGELISTS